MAKNDRERPKIEISDEDIERAVKNAEACKKLFERKTREEVFEELLRLTAV